jgi:hypothetical protein
MLGGDILQALQAQPGQTSVELADRFGVSDRHIRRVIRNLPVSTTRAGRVIRYSAAEEEAAAVAASSSITTPPQQDIGHQQKIADINSGHLSEMSAIDCGHLKNHDGTIEKNSGHIEDNIGHNSGHPKKENSKNLYRNRRRDTGKAGHPPKSLRSGPEFSPYLRDARTGLYPHQLAYYEIDMVQFVLIDRSFRDLLHRTISQRPDWQAWKSRGVDWIRIPDRHLTLQLGRSTVTFYSDDPGDMSAIAEWAREEFRDRYQNIESLVSRIRYPQSLSVEELCVVVTDPAVIANIRVSIEKDAKNGVFTLPAPNETDPALKIYERDGTMRVEFIATNHTQAVKALGMRENLMGNLTRMHEIPGLFWEFIQRYYSALHHPIIIDTGAHEFIEAHKQTLSTLERIVQQFSETIRALALQKREDPAPAAAKPEPATTIRDGVDKLTEFDITELEKLFRAARLNNPVVAMQVFLAAWSVWASRKNFKGQVLKEEIVSTLSKANTPLDLAGVADAIEELQNAGLMVRDPKLEVKFSNEGATIAKKLQARYEGL